MSSIAQHDQHDAAGLGFQTQLQQNGLTCEPPLLCCPRQAS